MQSEVPLQDKGKGKTYEDEISIFNILVKSIADAQKDDALALGPVIYRSSTQHTSDPEGQTDASLAQLFQLLQTQSNLLTPQQQEITSLRLYLAYQSKVLSNQRAFMMAQIDHQVHNVRSFNQTFMKYLGDALPAIIGYSSLKKKVAVLQNDVNVSIKHFQSLHESTQERIRGIESRIPTPDALHNILDATAPLWSRIEELESRSIHPSRLERIECDINDIFTKVEFLFDDAKKGAGNEGIRDIMGREISIASVGASPILKLPPVPPLIRSAQV